MYVQQLFTAALARAGYFIQSNREAALIDPPREVEACLQLSAARGTDIRYIFETCFRDEFVFFYQDLVQKTGATLVFGPQTRPSCNAYVAMDKEIFHIGDMRIKVIHTPGYTAGSCCFLLIDEDSRNHGIFTGDTLRNKDMLFPVQAVSDELPQQLVAGMLFDSLKKLKELEDDVVVYPARKVATSLDGAASSGYATTMGEQKRFNAAMQIYDREEFIRIITQSRETPFFQASASKTDER